MIGAGSAGFSAAIGAANMGKKTLLIGYGTIGGTCVNFGCVPSKTLIRAAQAMHGQQVASRFDGVEVTSTLASWQRVQAQKQQLVDDLQKAKYIDLLPDQENITYVDGKAIFNQAGQLEVSGKSINAAKIIVATGSRQHIPGIKGMENIDYLTSQTALELETLPKSMLIIGGGYIGVELAQMFARFGVKITIMSRRGLLPNAEPEISLALSETFKQAGLTLIKADEYVDLVNENAGIKLAYASGTGMQNIAAEKLLIATGRVPNVENLNLENAGIMLNQNGGVEVDQHMRTSNKNIYAVGDVTNIDNYVYMAAYGAKIATANAMSDEALNDVGMIYDNKAMPAVVFTDPQVASVGLTEKAAKESGLNVKTSILTLDNLPRALAAQNVTGLIKLVADADTKRLIGGQIMAEEAGDSIQTLAMAIKMNMTYTDLASMIFPYLTNVEGLKLAAQTFDMDVKKLSCCAG
ncbi:MAG: mercury(II) reductase [Rhizobiales bacterium]|nr:mercury(II) reductase [Hyphomicrobiales bacterium]